MAQNDLFFKRAGEVVCPEVHKASDTFLIFFREHAIPQKEGSLIDQRVRALAFGEMTLSACGKRESRG